MFTLAHSIPASPGTKCERWSFDDGTTIGGTVEAVFADLGSTPAVPAVDEPFTGQILYHPADKSDRSVVIVDGDRQALGARVREVRYTAQLPTVPFGTPAIATVEGPAICRTSKRVLVVGGDTEAIAALLVAVVGAQLAIFECVAPPIAAESAVGAAVRGRLIRITYAVATRAVTRTRRDRFGLVAPEVATERTVGWAEAAWTRWLILWSVHQA